MKSTKLYLVLALLALVALVSIRGQVTCNGEDVDVECAKQCCPGKDACTPNVDYKPKLCPLEGTVECVCAANVTAVEFAKVVFVNQGVQNFGR